MLKIGKKTKQWNALRRKLVTAFQEAGITYCEIRLDGCMSGIALGFAHIDKRRNLAPEELDMVVLACQSCHDKIEYTCEELTGDTMREYLTKIINSRNVPVKRLLK